MHWFATVNACGTIREKSDRLAIKQAHYVKKGKKQKARALTQQTIGHCPIVL